MIHKISSRNVVGVIGGRSTIDNVNKFDADKVLEQCLERLKTDPNYKQNDYDVDVTRCKALKMQPNGVQTVQSNNVWDGNGSKLIPNNHNDDVLNGFNPFPINHYNKNNGNVGRFSHDPSMSMMNVATPESRTSFFFY